jgi:hypothetical protein
MNRSKKIKAAFLTLLCLILTFSGLAQKSFRYQALVNKVDSSGFYNISLQPDLIAKSKGDLSDIRLTDQNGSFVSYIKSSQGPRVGVIKFHAFHQVSSELSTDTGTTFIVEPDQAKPINLLYLKLKNAEVDRRINVSGSDDMKHWYAIKEGVKLEEGLLNDDGTSMQPLSLPASSYHYLKFLVNDKNKARIKFLAAGVYIHLPVKNPYLPVTDAAIIKKDSDKTTVVTIRLNDFYLIDLFHLKINSPKYYKRKVMVYQFDDEHRELIGYDDLTSNSNSDLPITLKSNHIQLEIINGDNRPLDIGEIKLFQKDQAITAYLEAGRSYKLLAGDKNAKAPEYDLRFFADSIRDLVPEISHGPVMKNIAFGVQPVIVKRDYSILIWAAIIIALLVLSLLTWKMAGEVTNRK